jgi:hypothetical protein
MSRHKDNLKSAEYVSYSMAQYYRYKEKLIAFENIELNFQYH